MPNNEIKEKCKMLGISQNNTKFINPLNGVETNKMNFDILECLYLNSLPNVDINTLFKENCSFYMPDKLKKLNFRRNNDQKLNKVPLFSIHSSSIERTILQRQCNGITMYEGFFTVPNFRIYCRQTE